MDKIKMPMIKSLKNVDTESNSNDIVGNCPHCKKQITAPKKRIKKEIYKTKIEHRAYPRVNVKLKENNKRISSLENQMKAKKISFSLFDRKYTLWIKKHARLEDVLVPRSLFRKLF